MSNNNFYGQNWRKMETCNRVATTKKWYNANSRHLSSLFFSCFSNNPHIQNKHFFDFLYLIPES